MSRGLLLLAGCAGASLSAISPESVVLLQVHAGLHSKDASYMSIGDTADLTEVGYQAVAQRHNDTEMASFISRQLSLLGLEPGEGKMDDLNGLTPWFSGTTAVQSLESLTIELMKATWTQQRTAARSTGAQQKELLSLIQKNDVAAANCSGEGCRLYQEARGLPIQKPNGPPSALLRFFEKAKANASQLKANRTASTLPAMANELKEIETKTNGTEVATLPAAVDANGTTPTQLATTSEVSGAISRELHANVVNSTISLDESANKTVAKVADNVEGASVASVSDEVANDSPESTALKIEKGITAAVQHAGGFIEKLSRNLWDPAALSLKVKKGEGTQVEGEGMPTITIGTNGNPETSDASAIAIEGVEALEKTHGDAYLPNSRSHVAVAKRDNYSGTGFVKLSPAVSTVAVDTAAVQQELKAQKLKSLQIERRKKAKELEHERQKAKELEHDRQKAKRQSRQEEAARRKAAIKMANQLPLRRDGYESMLAQNSSDAARVFIHRVAEKQGLRIVSEHAFDSMLRFYGGGCGAGSYNALIAELHSAAQPSACGDLWIERAHGEAPTDILIDRWAGMAERMPTWRWLYKASRRPASLLAQAVSRHNAAGHRAKTTAVGGFESIFGRVDTMLHPGSHLGSSSELSLFGYEAVANAGSAVEMIAFIRRVAAQEGLEITDEQALKDMLPFYDGECDTQSYDTLINELHDARKLSVSCGGSWAM